MKLPYPITAFVASIQQIFRDIHGHPEPGYQELRISDVVAQKPTE